MLFSVSLGTADITFDKVVTRKGGVGCGVGGGGGGIGEGTAPNTQKGSEEQDGKRTESPEGIEGCDCGERVWISSQRKDSNKRR